MPRQLPTAEEAVRILRTKRTRPIGRPPPPAGRALRGYLKQMDERFSQGADALAARWREIVGPDIARRTEPVKLVKARAGGVSTLEIRVAGPAAAIIQHQAHEILGRVNLFLGADAVGKLRIVQGPLRRPEPPPPKRRAAPLDAALEAKLAADLAEAPEGKLKDALTKLGRGVLRRSK